MSTPTKPNDGARRALPGEPTFTLLARDPQAPGLLLLWSSERMVGVAEGRFPASDAAQAAEAEDIAHRMLAWRQEANFAWRRQNPELPLPHAEALPEPGDDFEILRRRRRALVQAAIAAGAPFGVELPEPPLCEDEGCPQHGTPHVCVTSPFTSDRNPEPATIADPYPRFENGTQMRAAAYNGEI